MRIFELLERVVTWVPDPVLGDKMVEIRWSGGMKMPHRMHAHMGDHPLMSSTTSRVNEMMRVMLYEAAQSMLHSKKWSWLKAWAMQIARGRGKKKAMVALARRLAVILHRIWVDGTEFRWTREQTAAAA